MNNKILIIPIGSAGGLNWWKSLRDQPNLDIIGSDCDPIVAGRWLAPEFVQLPNVINKDFSVKLLSIVKEQQIEIVIPVLDPILESMARLSSLLKNSGASLLLPPLQVVRAATDKRKTYSALQNVIRIPEDFTHHSDVELPYPVLVKPAISTGSVNIFIAENPKELAFWRKYIKEAIVQEYLPGIEYTIDCLSNFDSEVLVASPRLRHRVRAGLSVIGTTVSDIRLQEMAKKISTAMKLQGPWFFQTRQDGRGEHVVIEVNARIAGGVMATVKAGANIPRLALQLYLTGKSESAQARPGVSMVRYYEEIFVDAEKKI